MLRAQHSPAHGRIKHKLRRARIVRFEMEDAVVTVLACRSRKGIDYREVMPRKPLKGATR